METLVQDQYAIEVQDLSRVFRDEKKKKKDFLALDRLNLKVKEGEIFGLLGPNGAGKTTLIKILATLLLPSSGRVLVGGIDPVQDSFSVRRKISMVSGGEHSGYGVLTVREHLLMFSQFYGLPLKTARPRVDELIRALGLEDKANAKINKLSTGLRQKMNFARGFVSDPEIIFLDEPTLGLDVGASRVVRSYVKDWARRGRRTVLLTTHYMAEAEEMCDRVAIIDQGKILACDTPANLKSLLTKESVLRLEVSLSRFTGSRCGSPASNAGVPLSESAEEDQPVASEGGLSEGNISSEDVATMGLGGLTQIPGVKRVAASGKGEARLELTILLEEEPAIAAIMGQLTELGASVLSLRKEEPSLEDVFLKLVGRKLTEEAAGA